MRQLPKKKKDVEAPNARFTFGELAWLEAVLGYCITPRMPRVSMTSLQSRSFSASSFLCKTLSLMAASIGCRSYAILVSALRSDRAFGSRKLARLAGIEYSDRIIPILRKLRDAQRIAFEEGKWRRL